MIRRGLQILIVGITALGAAPSFAQVGTTNFPTQVTLQDFSDPLVNGLYVMVGGTGSSSGYVFQRYAPQGTAPQRWLTIGDHNTSTQIMYRVWNQNPSSPHGDVTGLLFVAEMYGTYTQTQGSFKKYVAGLPSDPGVAINSWYLPPPTLDEQLEEAFPDWQSAGVKIPLGFTFGMGVWASFLAGTIALKWVRELSSAAT